MEEPTPEQIKLIKDNFRKVLESLPKENDGEQKNPVSEIVTNTFIQDSDTILEKVKDTNMKLDKFDNYKEHIETLFDLLRPEKGDKYKEILTKLYNGNWELLIVQKQFGRTQSQIDYDMVKSIIIAKIAIELSKGKIVPSSEVIIKTTDEIPREEIERTNDNIQLIFDDVFAELGFLRGGGFFSSLKDTLTSGFTKTKDAVSTGYNKTKSYVQEKNTALNNYTKKVKQRGFVDNKRLFGILGEGGLFGKIRKYAEIISDKEMMFFIPNISDITNIDKKDILNIIECENLNTNSNNFGILPTFIIEIVILLLEKGLKLLINKETTIVSFLENRLFRLKQVLLAKNKRECDKVSAFFKGKIVDFTEDCDTAFKYPINRTRCRRLLKTKEKCKTTGGKKSRKMRKHRKTIGGAGPILDFIDKNSNTKNGLILMCVILGIIFLSSSGALPPLAVLGVFLIGVAINIQCFYEVTEKAGLICNTVMVANVIVLSIPVIFGVFLLALAAGDAAFVSLTPLNPFGLTTLTGSTTSSSSNKDQKKPENKNTEF